MKVFKIDVVNKRVTEVHINKSKDSYLNDIYKHLQCKLIDIVSLHKTLDLYIDDEGLLRDDPIGAFKINGSDFVFSGHGLIVGNNEGDPFPPPITLDNITKAILFCNISDLSEPFSQVISE